MQSGKTCLGCWLELPLEAFTPRTDNPEKRVPRCRKCHAVKSAEYKKRNPEKVKAGRRRHYENNMQKEIAYMCKYKSDKLKSDPLYKHAHTLHNALNRYLDKKPFESKYAAVFGLDPYDLEIHLIGTAIDNYGYWLECGTYQIDHKIPRCTGKTRDELDKLFHFPNLQLLTPEDNRAKGANVL